MESRLGIYGKKPKDISNPVTIAVTVCICLGFWALGYSESIGLPIEPGEYATPLWQYICSFLKKHEIATYLGGFILLFFTSIAIHRGSFVLLIINGKTTLPFLFFLLFNSSNPDTYPIQASSIALLFLLGTLYELFRSYQHPVNVGRIYNATMYIAIGSLFWVYLLWFIPLFWYGLYKFRLINIRNFFASVLGIFTTYLFIFAWCIWKHDFSLLKIPMQNLASFDLIFLEETIQANNVATFSIVLFIAISIYVILRKINTLRTRQYFTFLLIFCIYSFLLIFIYEHDNANILSIFYIPASVLLAYLFSNRSGFISYLSYYSLVLFFVILFILRLWNY